MKNSVIIFLVFITTTISHSQVGENIDKYLEPIVENKDFSGIVAISKNDSLIHIGTYGYANIEWDQRNTENTVFHIASLTKQFTAAAILIAEQKGLLNTEDPISKYLKEYPNGEKITIEHLLSQRSGIPDYNGLNGYSEFSMKESTLTEVVNWFKDEPLQFNPGSKYLYSNSNFVLAAKILETVTGHTYSGWMQKVIFQPLNMTQTGNFKYQDIVPFRATGYDPAFNGVLKAPYYNKSFKVGSGSIYSSVIDLLKWDKALNSEKILTEKSKNKLFKDYGDNYGLGWGVYTNEEKGRFVSHDGKAPGYFAYMKKYFDNDLHITIVILSNINSGIMNSMKSDITNIVFNQDYPVYQKYKILPVPEDLKLYIGKYDFPPKFNFRLVEKDGKLFFQWMDTNFLQYLTPIGKDEFMMRSRYDYLQFNRDEASGDIISVNYNQKGGVTICKKI